MMQFAVFFVFYLAQSINVASCQPFGLRVYYGDILIDENSSEKAVVYFNTKASCSDSFINVMSSEGFKKITCEHLQVQTSSFVNFYIAHIHKCSIESIQFQKGFSYIAYGWQKTLQKQPTPHKNEWIYLTLIDPRPEDREVKLVALADWGIVKNSSKITPIVDDLKKIIHEKEIHVIIINGDVAYDLDSNNGTNYEEFLFFLETFSAKTPIIHVPGNHERQTPDAALLFNTSFKIYGLDKTLATGLSLGSLYLIPFDPFNVRQNHKQAVSSLQALKKELKKGAQTRRFILPCSHYPLVCSGQYKKCYHGFTRLHQFFQTMIDNGVSLYLGSHTHSYQRSYPYLKNDTFLTMQSPYNAQGGYLISVVQGVAGNDQQILTKMQKKREYTARYTVNETGFAVIKSTNNHLKYSHFSTKQGFMDNFKIIRTSKQSKKNTVKVLHLEFEQNP